ncbi:MAG: DUF3990 domain-containing protein [Christensenellaceae bacterium]|jgi:hypothetical protein|nr:DUF3990 domain-containing protein [Christensenellaceae bacterium]
MEWACTTNNNGNVNSYEINISSLTIFNLSDGKYNILNWLALLLKNRVFSTTNPLALEAKKYIINTFSVDTSSADIIIGYRADDSCFSFARDFVNNLISLNQLAIAMFLGDLGQQIVIVSDEAFASIRYTGRQPVDGKIYNSKRMLRDQHARDKYQSVRQNTKASSLDNLYILDILRGEIKNDDTRIQRIVPQ